MLQKTAAIVVLITTRAWITLWPCGYNLILIIEYTSQKIEIYKLMVENISQRDYTQTP